MFDDDVLNDVEKLQLAIEIMTGEAIDDPELASQIWKYIDEHFITTKKTLSSMIGKGILCQ